MTMRRSLRLLVLCLCPWWVAAANYCVDTEAGLRSALLSAGVSAEDDTIQLVQGSYHLSGDIDYLPPLPGGALSIIGGYLGDCSDGVRSTRAEDTRLSANAGTYFRIQKLAGNRLSRFANLRFWGFDEVRFAVGSCGAGGAILRLNNVRVSNGRDASGDALSLQNLCGDTRGYNLLVEGAAGDGLSAVSDGADEDVDIVNLTSVNNGGRGLKVIRLVDGTTRLWNAIVHGNGTDLYGNGGSFAVESSIYQSTGGAITVSGSNNLAVDPQLDANFYPIAALSPAIDSGTQASAISVGTSDLGGGPRIVGIRIDRGAFEFGATSGSTLTVVNTNDSGNGSLRDALLDAQATPGRQFIRFAIPGACPHVIMLSSVLPELTDLVSIDGYSQPGARANDSILGFNALPCVVVAAGNPTLTHGLRIATIGDGGSEVQGLAFSGFLGTDSTAAAIQLDSGSDHRLYGNQFGGSVAGQALIGSRNAIRILAAADRLEIGGDLAERNLISGSIESGVFIASEIGRVVVRGNLVGTGSSGNSALANGTGVSIRRSPENIVSDNLISGNLGHGITIRGGASDDNRIEDNRIGVKALAFCLPPCTPNPALPNGGDGISIARAAGDAVTDVPEHNELDGNEIAFSGGAGLRIEDGWGNQWRDNRVHDNGELGIDIGPPGVNPIDDDSSQTQAVQGGINRPQILAIDGAGADVEISGVHGIHNVLLFANAQCDASGFGEGGELFAADEFSLPEGGYSTSIVRIEPPAGETWNHLHGRHVSALLVHQLTLVQTLPIPILTAGRGVGEFSQCVQLNASDELFLDGFE